MDNLNFIMSQCKKGHYGKWTEESITECKQRIEKLSHDELFSLRISRWFQTGAEKHPLYESLYSCLHKDSIEKSFAQFENTSTPDLLVRYKEVKVKQSKMKILSLLNQRFESINDDETKKKVEDLLIRHSLRKEKQNKK